MADLYEELGIKPDATKAEIKAAGRRAAKEHHPDAGGDAAVFARKSRALAILRDPEKRAHYGRTGDDGGSRSPLDSPVQSILAQALAMVLGRLADEGPEHFDIPARMRRWLEERIVQGEEAQAAIEETQATLESAIERLSFNGEGPDYIGDILRGKAAQNRQNRVRNEALLAQHREALALLPSWEYRCDPKPEPASRTQGFAFDGRAPSMADLAEMLREDIERAKDRAFDEILFGGPGCGPIPRYDMPRGKR